MFSIALEVLGNAEELCITLGGGVACLGSVDLNQLGLIVLRLEGQRRKDERRTRE